MSKALTIGLFAIALTAAVVAGVFALVGCIASHWLTEPKPEHAEE